MSLRLLPLSCIGLCVALAACVPLAPADNNLRRWESAEVERLETSLRVSPRRLRDSALENWLAELLLRIDPLHGGEVRIYLLDLRAPQADLVGDRLLRVRAGLLSELRNEAELVFVLAHELAHRSLGHIAARRRPDWNADTLEQDADRAAVQALRRLGHRPETGAELLARMQTQLGKSRDRERLERRIEALGAVPPKAGKEPRAATDARFELLLAPYRARADQR